MMKRRFCLIACAGIGPLLLALLSQAAPAPQAQRLQYNRDIRPILAENCFPCHGPDSAARKADLRLDRPEDAKAKRGSHAAIVPGNPAASELVKRITGQAPLMPPPTSHKKLSARQIATLKQWIAQGAEYERHWSYIPPVRPALPSVTDEKWVRNPIDRFVLARLEKEGLKPAPEADRRTLIRRLSLDLTGLPPTPEETERFVSDRSERAYENLVDRLLTSPHWGEHRARYWLDAARYADTHGIHFDNYREMWSYRDWVINAFNRNLPFDQFSIQQLAGDLLPNPDLDQLIATGFNRCNITTNEGGAIDEEYLVLYNRDRTETVAQTWLGTTAGCAVCHDHKFDPLSQREFYEMAAFFNNSTQRAMDGNIKDTPPIIPVPQLSDRPRFEELKKEIPAARARVEERKKLARPEFDAWLTSSSGAKVDVKIPAESLRVHLPLSEGQGREVQALLDGQPVKLSAAADPAWEAGHVGEKAFKRTPGSAIEIPQAGDFEKDQPFTAAAWVKLASPNQGGAVMARMDDQNDYRGWDVWLEDGRVGMHVIHKWPEDALKTVSDERVPAGGWHHVCVTYDGSVKVEGIRVYIDGVLKPASPQANQLKSSIRAQVPLKIGQRHTTAAVDGMGIQDARIYGRALTPGEVTELARGTRVGYLTSRGAEKLAAPEKDELYGWWLSGRDAEYRSLTARLSALESEDQAIRQRGTIAHIWEERKDQEPMAYILSRGEYDKRKEAVKPDTPDILPPMPADYPKNRLGFAKWLFLPEHPLTARVTVNRFWQELFGVGLVRTSEDFGVSGELPSHPELLDWLAVEFRESEWDIKKLFKLMVTSSTYRQSAVVTPEKKQKDPQNRLLSRGPRFRMDAEMVRDYALAASGLLVRKIGGPSVRPYQPDGVWEAVAMIGSNTRDYKRDSGESLYRRSLYTFWKRAAPPASMEIFNAPNRETCAVRRERTNTPLQALVTLNDVQFIEAARNLAERTLRDGGQNFESRLDYAARRILARPLRPEEAAVASRSLARLQEFYRSHEKEAGELITAGESRADAKLDARDLAAWTMLINQLLNMDEVLNK